MSHLDNEQHISQDLLLRYVEDDCSRLEMRAIDRHLATCPTCSDAVEGLMLLSEPSVAVAELNKKIDAKVEQIIEETPVRLPIKLLPEEPILQVVKRPFWQQRWAAAAAILLLFSGSFWFYKNSQKAVNQEVANIESPIIADSLEKGTPQYMEKNGIPSIGKTDSEQKNAQISANSSTQNSVASSHNSAQKTGNNKPVLTEDLGQKTNDVATAKPSETVAKPTADIAVSEPKVEAEKAAPVSASAPVVYAPQTDRTRDYAGASNMNSVPRPTTSAPTKSEDITVTKVDGYRTTYDKNGDKKLEEVVVTGATAKKTYEKAKAPAAKKDSREGGTGSSVPTLSEQFLSRADDNFKQKKYENAATDYTQFLNLETSGDRPERALFQLASCYAKLNRKAEAKVIFEKLSATDGQFQRAAKKALKEL
jgi:hypothetical protein